MLVVQGTTGAAHSVSSFLSGVLPGKSDFKRDLSIFSWPAFVASGFYVIVVNLTVILAVPAGTKKGDVVSGGTLSSFLPPAEMFPGPLLSLALRGLQLTFSLWSLFTMLLASDYKTVKAFV